MTSWSPEFFQQIMGPFVAATGWAGAIYNFALPLYFMFATLTLAYAVVSNLIARDAAGMASDLGRTIIGIGVGYEVLINAVIIGNALFNTFTQIAIAVSGFPAAAVSPDGLMTIGAVMVSTLMTAVGWGTWLIHTTSAIFITVLALIIFVFFLVMAGILMLLLIEGFIAITAGTIFIPFSAPYLPANYLGSWLRWILAVSIQLFFMLLILSIGVGIELGWAAELNANAGLITGDFWIGFTALAQTLVLVGLSWWAPRQARNLILGGQGMGLGALVTGARAALAAGGAVAGGTGAVLAAGGASAGSTDAASFIARHSRHAHRRERHSGEP